MARRFSGAHARAGVYGTDAKIRAKQVQTGDVLMSVDGMLVQGETGVL